MEILPLGVYFNFLGKLLIGVNMTRAAYKAVVIPLDQYGGSKGNSDIKSGLKNVSSSASKVLEGGQLEI